MDFDVEELASNYSELTDEELLRMHDSGGLTEVAKDVLEKELIKRGISIPQNMEETETQKGRPRLPRSLKVAVGFMLTYGVLVFLGSVSGGATAYSIGYGVGSILLWIIITWALIRVKKYGWGFSVFFVCGKILEHILELREATVAVADPYTLRTIILGGAILMALLLGALTALILPSSRKPFSQLRHASKKQSRV